MASRVPEIIHSNGHKMPILGLGTGGLSVDNTSKVINTALETGYRHIDTAYTYGNEAEIGEVLKKWIDSGRLKRQDLFIVTKLPPVGNHADSVEKYLKKSLENLHVDYVDLYLIHHTIGLLEEKDKDGVNLVDPNTDLVSIWKAMEAQVDAGRAHSIGLSNFNSEQIKRIWKAARIKPVNLQVELNVYFQQRELVAFCNALDMSIVAYGPIGSPHRRTKLKGTESSGKSDTPLTDPVVQRIAENHKKTTAQVLLRHTMQRGIAVIPRSVHPERVKENFDVFDFELTPEEVDALDALDEGPKGRISTGPFGHLQMKHPEFPYNIRY